LNNFGGMVLNMDISGKLYIWVTEIKPYEDKNYILDGRPFDDEYGFGLEDLRNYSGDILFVSSKEYTKSKVEIGLAHISRKGTLWTLKTDYLPITPFLMTSNTLIKHKYSGKISLNPSEEAKQIFNNFQSNIYPIVSTDFIGIIVYTNSSWWLEAFSELDKEILTKEQNIILSESSIEG